jgi:hypothetical protein
MRGSLGVFLACLLVLALVAPAANAQKGTVAILENAGYGVAVNNSTGNLYVAAGDHVEVYDSTGILLFQFGSFGEQAGQMEDVRGIAINQSTGDVYLVDQLDNRMDRFDAAGNFISAWGNDVDASNPSTGFEVCTAASGHTCKYGEAGTGKGQLVRAFGDESLVGYYVAIAPDGKVYVSEPGYRAPSAESKGNRRIEIYSPSGDWLNEFKIPSDIEPCTSSGTGTPCTDSQEPRSIAIDSSGTVYTTPGPLVNSPDSTYSVKKYTSSGTPAGIFADALITNHKPLQVAINRTNGHVFVYQLSDNNVGYEVAEYDSNGKQIQLWGVGVLGETTQSTSGLAVNSISGRVYLATGDGRVLVMDTLSVLPEAAISPATGVTTSTAELHGTVNPQGTSSDTGWHFEYRRQGEATWNVSPKSDVIVGNGTSDVPADHEITGLDPSTTYESRLVAQRKDGAGSGISNITTFATDPALPVLSLIAPTKVTDTTATLQGMIDPKHSPTTYSFVYGTDTNYGSNAPNSGVGIGGSQLGRSGVFEPVTGLEPGTTYHFRLIAQNAAGATESDDMTFVTQTTAEMDWPERAMQMINQPDVGNQPVQPGIFTQSTISADGGRVLWQTLAGAPGSTTGFHALYLSRRTSAGWISQHIGVPASEQVAGGDYAYTPSAASLDLTGFALTAESGYFDANHAHTLVRMDDQGGHEPIADFDVNDVTSSLNVTSGATHVLYKDPFNGNLIDFHDGAQEVLPTPTCGFSVGENVDYTSDPDATRLFMNSSGSEDCGLPPAIFMIDREEVAPAPIRISGPQNAAAKFLRINRTGTSALFTKGENLYRWTVGESEACLTCGELPSGADLSDPVVSPDLSHVYFCAKVSSGCDVHVWREQGVARVATIKTFSETLRPKISPISTDGNTLLFRSILNDTTADPTGWDEATADSSNGSDSIQLYRYVDSTGVVECLSCSGTKIPPTRGVSGPTVLSGDGKTAAFVTPASLVDEDINGRQDVYEWHNGKLRLVTDGETEFVFGEPLNGGLGVWGLSDDGRTLVFSAGGVKLTGHEVNPFANAYSGIVGGEEIPVELPPAHCSEDACQGPLTPAPRLDFQGSSAFQGSGNVNGRKGHKKKAKHRKKKDNHKKKRAGDGGTRRSLSRGNG